MTTLARNVIPLRRPQAPEAKPRQPALFSADPRHAGLRFPRSTAEAFHDAEYACSIFAFSRPPWYVRLVRAVREVWNA
jgi:hypothetical protein